MIILRWGDGARMQHVDGLSRYAVNNVENGIEEQDEDHGIDEAKLEEFKLNELGEPISEKLIITKILTSLPTEYGYFISAWESMPENKRTLDILTARLMSESERINQGNENLNFNSSNASNALIGKTCYVCGKKGHISRFCKDKKATHNKNNKSQVDKTHIYCDYCKKPGHISKFCWCKKYKKNDKINKNAAFVGLDLSEMNSVLVDFNDDETWIADSGASEHTSNQKEWFENYYEFDKPTEIKIGNGSVKNAHGKGKISLIAFEGQDYIPTESNDVLYVPDIKFNLFSIGAALDKGYTMMTDNKTCKILKGNDVYAIGLRIDKLYHMQFRHAGSINVNLSISKTETVKDFHERFCHQNIRHVREILKKHNVNLNFNVKTIRTDNGYPECSKGYRVYFASENKIDIVRDVIFGKEQNKDLGVKENNENTRKCHDGAVALIGGYPVTSHPFPIAGPITVCRIPPFMRPTPSKEAGLLLSGLTLQV
ncbi:hypothetical protein ILUMI_21649 [Ignelater luminosus]|uniref:CCHC-type domain-containing protein n=1 Tax=Ignelater luminosus TaxID=2038154 RepID=A0A8K0G3N9_IGNLU|nr:hypothetical protein ILUMI_21649 [Ignelater luminosus]